MSGGELTPYNPEALPIRRSVTAGKLVDADVWTTYANIAQNVANTEFVPKDLRGKGPSVLACLLYGHDLGLGPMVALREITMIEGKPALSAALVTARVREAGHTLTWENIHDGDGSVVGVTARGKRADNGDVGEYTFTLKMAQRAGLVRERGPWQKYPESMCWARAATQLARMLFSDVFLGHATYAPEEIGGEIEDADVVMEIEGSAGEPKAGAGETASKPPVSAAGPSEPLSPADATPCATFKAGTTQAKTLSKLNMEVVEGRKAGWVTTEDVYGWARELAPALVKEDAYYIAEDGVLHWADLRAVVPLWLASQLIDRLKEAREFAQTGGRLAS